MAPKQLLELDVGLLRLEKRRYRCIDIMGGSREDSSRLLSALPSDRTGRQYADYVSVNLQILNSVVVPPTAHLVQASTPNLASFMRNSRRAHGSCRKATPLGIVI